MLKTDSNATLNAAPRAPLNATSAVPADSARSTGFAVRPIETRAAAGLPYDRFVRDYVAAGVPVIISGAVPEWSAVRDWTPDFFRQRYGSRVVDITYGVKQRLDEFIEAVLASTKENPGPYLHKVIIHQHMPDLVAALSPENQYAYPMRYCSPLMPRQWRRPDGYLKLLIGGVGGKFPLMHYDADNANAIITEIYGEKEFVLFSPEDSPFLYAPPDSHHTSPINDLDRPDLTRFPLFAKATQYRCVIGPGDAMFIPAGWWHSARVVTTSISVCANMIHRSNWPGFIDEACAPTTGRSGAVRLAKRLALSLAGAAMTLAENLQEKHPGGRISRGLAALSPVTRANGAQALYPRT